MAEEEVVHTSPATAEVAGSPVRSDYKRKFEDEAPAVPTPINQQPNSTYGVPVTDSSEAKRPRLEDNLKPDGLGDQNGLTLEKSDEPAIEEEENHELVKLNEQQTDTQSPPEDPRMQTEQDPEDNKEEPRAQMEQDLEDNKDVGGLVIQQVLAQDTEAANVGTQQVTAENTEADNVGVLVTQQVDAEADNVGGLVTQQVTAKSDNMGGLVTQQVSAKETLQPTRDFHRDEHGTMTRKMEIPNNKVGVLIGKAGETIRSLQNNSGAKIQITRDSEADPQATTRPVEIIGDLASIEKAEVLIKAVISEADAGGSASFGARGPAAGHSAGVSEQIEMPVPNEKVGLIIGKGGETIKGLQSRSGARIQLIPQHLQEDGSQERIVGITGNRKQTEMASVMIKDVMNQNPVEIVDEEILESDPPQVEILESDPPQVEEVVDTFEPQPQPNTANEPMRAETAVGDDAATYAELDAIFQRAQILCRTLWASSDAKRAEVREKEAALTPLRTEVAKLRHKVGVNLDRVSKLTTEKEQLQSDLDKLKQAVVDAEARESGLKEQAEKENVDAAAAIKAAKDEVEVKDKKIQDLEGQFSEAARVAGEREERVKALEVEVDNASQEAETNRADKVKLEERLRLVRIKIVKAQKSLDENFLLLKQWRPKIYQAGYDRCVQLVMDGTKVEDLVGAVKVPPGWWGEEGDCITGETFDDWCVAADEEDDATTSGKDVPPQGSQD